ncbi:MAG: TerB family tellurite resistance protein [Alphaproteobacteria bacterium]|nr:TerB family tellurite resistance protein [Alphaproteobacteria bacterium]MCB9691057.1 TerB family tellurite resistance protein [Alphaproteobacteria bacterium]
MPVPIQGEIALPTNPNCVLYAAPAAQAMDEGWTALQRTAWSALEQFYSSCGIDCVAYFGRRSWLDRRNHTVSQLLLMFVMDGPASSSDLQLIEAVFKRSPVQWSVGAMESMPQDAFPSLCVKSGKMYQLWSSIEGRPRYLRMKMAGDRLSIVGASEDAVTTADFLPYMKHVVAGRRRVRDEDWRMERMRIAFAHHYSKAIMEADGVIHADEREFMSRVFPPDVMESMGMSDHEARQVALGEAMEQLPALLGHHDKLAMVGLFFSVCHADGNLDAREMRVLKDAASVLGLDGNEVVAYLTRLW